MVLKKHKSAEEDTTREEELSQARQIRQDRRAQSSQKKGRRAMHLSLRLKHKGLSSPASCAGQGPLMPFTK